jgi:hypothetical protein
MLMLTLPILDNHTEFLVVAIDGECRLITVFVRVATKEVKTLLTDCLATQDAVAEVNHVGFVAGFTRHIAIVASAASVPKAPGAGERNPPSPR